MSPIKAVRAAQLTFKLVQPSTTRLGNLIIPSSKIITDFVF